jgi:HAD superfamily hydrolase (TIGR01450 family)
VTSSTRPSRIYPGYAFDLDGTVYIGDALVPGAAETIRELRARGAVLAFMTNKPLDTARTYASKLSDLGIPASETDVITSVEALRQYLRTHESGARVYAIAEAVVIGALRDDGWVLTEEPAEIDVVVVSFDRSFDYAKLLIAYRAVRYGARIVATNPDPACPTPDGGLPDCGAILAALETATGRRAEAIVGKPSLHMAEAVLARLDLAPRDVLLVGDRLLTDMTMASAVGMPSALVLSGVTAVSDLASAKPLPDFVLRDVRDLIPQALDQPGVVATPAPLPLPSEMEVP